MVSYNKGEQTRVAVCAQTPSPLSMRLAHGGTRLGHPSAREAKRTSDRSIHAEARPLSGRRGARKLPKALCKHAPFPAPHRHHSGGPGRGRESVRVIRPAVAVPALGVARARAVCVLPPSVGTPPLICGGGGEERGGCVPGRGADSAPRRHEHARRGALTIQEETPSIAMERCGIARICRARTT